MELLGLPLNRALFNENGEMYDIICGIILVTGLGAEPLPVVTPHVLRHTLCTNMANAGMDVKSLQYLMGHSDAGITMNTYTHASFDHAEKAMLAIVRPKGEEGEKRTG